MDDNKFDVDGLDPEELSRYLAERMEEEPYDTLTVTFVLLNATVDFVYSMN